jgi:hypothetical protein
MVAHRDPSLKRQNPEGIGVHGGAEKPSGLIIGENSPLL